MIIRLKKVYWRFLFFFMTTRLSKKNRFIRWKKKEIHILKNSKINRLQKNTFKKKVEILTRNTFLLYNQKYSEYYLQCLTV